MMMQQLQEHPTHRHWTGLLEQVLFLMDNLLLIEYLSSSCCYLCCPMDHHWMIPNHLRILVLFVLLMMNHLVSVLEFRLKGPILQKEQRR